MLFDRIIGNFIDASHGDANQALSSVELSWSQCFRRAQSVTTSDGQKIRILLPLGTSLRQGDVISNGHLSVLIQVAPCEVLVVRPTTLRQAALVALGLGNLHAPVECDGDEIITLPDGPIEELLTSMGAPFIAQRRRFAPTTVAASIRAQLADDFRVWTKAPRT